MAYNCERMPVTCVVAGMLGQYHQEASSFGPARGYSLCTPSQFMSSIAYAVPPGIIVLNPG